MVSPKGKRKIICEGSKYYWFVRKNTFGNSRIHILSEDKKINLEYPLLDTEIAVTPRYIENLLKRYLISRENTAQD